MSIRHFALALTMISTMAAPQSASAFRLWSRPAPAPVVVVKSGVPELVYEATDALVARAPQIARDRPILMTTIVSVDDYRQSSRLGRMASQMMMNRLAQQGFLIKDITYTQAMTIRPESGELVLSRDVSKLGQSVNAQSVVVGTYTVAGRAIYLSVRLLGAFDGAVLASVDLELPLNHNTEPLIASAGH